MNYNEIELADVYKHLDFYLCKLQQHYFDTTMHDRFRFTNWIKLLPKSNRPDFVKMVDGLTDYIYDDLPYEYIAIKQAQVLKAYSKIKEQL